MRAARSGWTGGAGLPCAPVRPTTKGPSSGAGRPERRPGTAAQRPRFAMCLWPGAQQRTRLSCALDCAHGKQFSIFDFNFEVFSFQFLFSVALVFYLMFKTLSHFLITSLKVTGQFMFYLDIAIISCVANKYLISKKIINIPLIRKLTKIWH